MPLIIVAWREARDGLNVTLPVDSDSELAEVGEAESPAFCYFFLFVSRLSTDGCGLCS